MYSLMQINFNYTTINSTTRFTTQQGTKFAEITGESERQESNCRNKRTTRLKAERQEASHGLLSQLTMQEQENVLAEQAHAGVLYLCSRKPQSGEGLR